MKTLQFIHSLVILLFVTVSLRADETTIPADAQAEPTLNSGQTVEAATDDATPDISGSWRALIAESFWVAEIERDPTKRSDFTVTIIAAAGEQKPIMSCTLDWIPKEHQFVSQITGKPIRERRWQNMIEGCESKLYWKSLPEGKNLLSQFVPSEKGQNRINALNPQQRETINKFLAPAKWIRIPTHLRHTITKQDKVDRKSSASNSARTSNPVLPLPAEDDAIADSVVNSSTTDADQSQTASLEQQKKRTQTESLNIILIEAADGISAFSKSTGTWRTIRLKAPKDGSTRVSRLTAGPNFAAVVVDDQLAGYNSDVGVWDLITIPGDQVGKVVPTIGVNFCVAKVGDRLYAMSPKTGKWTTADDSEDVPESYKNTTTDGSPPQSKNPDYATPPQGDYSATGDTPNSPTVVGLSGTLRTYVATPDGASTSYPPDSAGDIYHPPVQFDDFKPRPNSPLPGTQITPYTTPFTELSKHLNQLEAKCLQLSAEVRTLESTTGNGSANDERKELLDTLAETLWAKTRLEEMRIEALQTRLKRLQEQLTARTAQQNDILLRRMNELVNSSATQSRGQQPSKPDRKNQQRIVPADTVRQSASDQDFFNSTGSDSQLLKILIQQIETDQQSKRKQISIDSASAMASNLESTLTDLIHTQAKDLSELERSKLFLFTNGIVENHLKEMESPRRRYDNTSLECQNFLVEADYVIDAALIRREKIQTLLNAFDKSPFASQGNAESLKANLQLSEKEANLDLHRLESQRTKCHKLVDKLMVPPVSPPINVDFAFWGMRLKTDFDSNITQPYHNNGIFIVDQLTPDSIAAKAGLQLGDYLSALNRQRLTIESVSPIFRQLSEKATAKDTDKSIAFQVRRRDETGSLKYVDGTLPLVDPN